MAWMFRKASMFTGDVSKWNTGAVTDMAGMFYGASSFNGDVSKWNTSAVTDMLALFNGFLEGESSFNGDVNKLNTDMADWLKDSASGFCSYCSRPIKRRTRWV
jgi:surface protein